MKTCALCNAEFDPATEQSIFAEAGAWLAEEIWCDGGELCPTCLESRAKLVMMYHHEFNT